eukprot:COSAG02_NODE_30407_length_551_cov_1.858407_1_plen_79_part_00
MYERSLGRVNKLLCRFLASCTCLWPPTMIVGSIEARSTVMVVRQLRVVRRFRPLGYEDDVTIAPNHTVTLFCPVAHAL